MILLRRITFWKMLWLLGMLAAAPFARAQNDSFQTIDKESRKSIVYIHAERLPKDGVAAPYETSGTGFIISKSGYVLTNAHLLLKEDDASVVKYEGSVRSRYLPPLPLFLVAKDESIDIALFELPDTGTEWKPLTLDLPNLKKDWKNEKPMTTSSPLFTMGFPFQSDLSSATGILSNRVGPHGNWQTTLPINYGNSGSPVFRSDGSVVGIAQGGMDQAQGITYVVPITHAYPLVSMAGGVAFGSRSKGGENNVSTVAFFARVGEGDEREVRKTFCGPDGTMASVQDVSTITKAGEKTYFTGFDVSADRPNCVTVAAHISAVGRNDASIVDPTMSGFTHAKADQKGGWLGAGLNIRFNPESAPAAAAAQGH
jgi:Trypsin-like serine proteases, typically periplasmic, contain C-terminal PDZ domain